MRFIRRPKKFAIVVFLFFFGAWISAAIFDLVLGYIVGTIVHFTRYELKNRPLKAFISSAYYYPKSKSLGENALALVMNINLVKGRDGYEEMQAGSSTDPTEIVVMARNGTASVVVSTPYVRVTPHEVCQIITIFATVQLLPNVESINMISDNGMTEIPFQIPSYTKRDVVVCTSPLFVSEQWQNFLFAVHIYRKFGGFMNLYMISAVSSFFELMKEYEKEGYMTIQPWVSVKFPRVPLYIADSYEQVEFRSQAAAQTDCLLQYKESAQFVTFLDLDDVLIPKLAPTFIEEFQMIMAGKKRLAYIFYHKENFDVVTVRDSSKFSIKKMFASLKYKNVRETGKIVVDPKNLNYTWIHYPPFLANGMEKYEVTENVITHLKTIYWSDEQIADNKRLVEPVYYKNSTEKLVSSKQILDIEADLHRMMRKRQIRSIFPRLPKLHYFSDTVAKCYNDRYYRYHYSGRIGEIRCPGPQLCKFNEHPKIKCMHVDAIQSHMDKLTPITYYYATNPHFSPDIGCLPH